MPDARSDIPAAEQLAAVLRDERKKAGVSGVELARRTGYSQSTISRMERGDLAVSMVAAARWAWHLRLSRSRLREMVELARAVDYDRAGLVPIRVMLQQGAQSIQRRIRLRERNVREQWVFHPAVLPGPLQHDGYMQEIMAEDSTAAEAAALVAERKRRQRESATRDITFVITEGTVMQGGPSAEVMAAQCDHLADLAVGHSHWRVGVVPRVAGRLNTAQNGFDLYDPTTIGGAQLFLGFTAGNALVKDEATVRAHIGRFQQLVQMAVFGEAAREVLVRIAEDYRRMNRAGTD